MSTVDYNLNLDGMHTPSPAPRPASQPKVLHRVREVRRQQGVSLRSVSRRLRLPMPEVREQENPEYDLSLTQLVAWQRALDVPLTDLLVECEGPLSAPVRQRASLLRVMKTAKALVEGAHNDATTRMAAMLVRQLIDVMPELEEVSAWHSVGQRRTQEEMGRIVERTIPDSLFGDSTY